MAVETPFCNFGWPAPGFVLPDLAGRPVRLTDIRGKKGTLVMFLCNHCPFVRAIEDRIARDAATLSGLGIGVAAICSNDASDYPADGPSGLAEQVARAGFDFPYLIDEEQTVARAYEAACTPDFFGFDAGLGLQYRGRLDASRATPGPADLRRELVEAMTQVAMTGHGPEEQVASMGCSIKWKAA
ncbi:MAG: thioredoxin family protein [Pseudomonadota bacterium]